MTPDDPRELIAEANQYFLNNADSGLAGPDLVHRLATALAVLSAPQEAKPGTRLAPDFRASLVDIAKGSIQAVWDDVPDGVDAETLAQNVVGAQEFAWIARGFPVTPQEGDARERLDRLIEKRLHPSPFCCSGYERPREGHDQSPPCDTVIARKALREEILAAFPVLSRAAAPEPEWEYATTQWGIDRQPHGRLTRGEITPEQWFAELGDREDLALVRRRKAGPWEPLPVGGDD